MVRAIRRLHEALTIPLTLALVAGCGSALEGQAPGRDGDVSPPRDTDLVSSDIPDQVPPDGDGVEPDTDPETVGPSDSADSANGEVGPDTDVFVPAPEWEIQTLGDEGLIEGLVLVRADLGFASSGARVLRWDGRSWLAYGEPGRLSGAVGPAAAIHGVAADAERVVAVGAGGSVAVRPVSGGSWATVETPFTNDLRAATLRDGRLFVAGDGGRVASLDLTAGEEATWTTHFTSGLINLRGIWARPQGDGVAEADEGVFAVGTGGQLVFRDGSTWRATQVAANTVVLRDIIGLADGTLVAVGDQHTVTVKRPNAPAWQGQATNDDRRRDLAALALSRDGTLRAFGASGAVLRQEGTIWSLDSAASVSAGLKDFRAAMAVPNSSAVMALASHGGGVRFDGSSWQSIATSPESTINGLAGTGESLWAVGNRGVLARRDAGGWSGVPTGSAADLNAIAVTGTGASEVAWAVGDAGTIVKVVDGVPRLITAPVPLDLFGVAATASAVFACGRGGTLLQIDPEDDAVTVRLAGTTADLRAIAVGGDGALWVSGSFGTLLRWADTALTPVPVLSGVGGSLNGLAPTATGVLAVGDNGVILRATSSGVTLEDEEPGRFLYAVATRGSRALAVGSGGRILRHEDGGWVAEVPAERGATFESAWIGPDGEAIVGGIFRVHHLESRLLPLP